MLTLLTPTGSLDDIVFEGRNQAYGAFQLRRAYQRNLGSALLITVASAGTLLLLVPLVLPRFSAPEVVLKPIGGCTLTEFKPQVYEAREVKPTVQKATVQRAVTVTPHATIQTQVVRNLEKQPVTESTLPPNVGPTGPAKAGEQDPTGTSMGTGTATIPGVDSAKAAPDAKPAAVLYAEVMPDFVGGRSALQRYLQRHLKFPAAALAAQVSGKVFVSFVVQTDGSIGEVTVLKGLGYGTEEAAARVVSEMPAWTPGLQNHHSVPVRFTLPITFQYE